MAASYASKNTDRFEGVILLGSYTNKNLTESGLRVLSIYGSLDSVLNLQKYNDCKSNLPSDLKEIVIEGGNHSGFAMYGLQSGDTKSLISNEEQISRTADLIADFTK